MSQKKKNNIILGSLCAVVLLMVVGYAAFQSVLNITGTSKVSSNWNILITNIETKNIVGGASNASEPTGKGTLTATFNTNLVSPGDSIEYDITVSNQGSLNAVLEKINVSDSNNPAIKFTTTGITEGDPLNAGESAVLTVKVEYDNAVTSQPESTKSELTVTLDYVQADGSSVTPGGETAADKLIATATDTGDGLYADTTEAGRYIYKGTNPNNYITFNNETWRIMSVESDNTIKIIRNESIGNRAFDSKGLRDSTSNGAGGTYCAQSSYGCNAWTVNDNFVNGSYTGTVLKDAELNIYLNGAYLGTINDDKQYIVNHNFNVGTPGDTDDTEDIATDVAQEALYKWNGKIGLMNVTDVLKTTSNTTCTSLNAGYDSDSTGYCNTNNWMWTKSDYEWTVSPFADLSDRVWIVDSDGYVVRHLASNDGCGVRPVLYLTSNIQLDGEGTSGSPYTIVSK